MPDGAVLPRASPARSEDPQGSFSERPRRTALLLGCDLSFKGETAYGAALPPNAVAVGPACRLVSGSAACRAPSRR